MIKPLSKGSFIAADCSRVSGWMRATTSVVLAAVVSISTVACSTGAESDEAGSAGRGTQDVGVGFEESAGRSVAFHPFSLQFELLQDPAEAARFPDNAVVVHARLVSRSPSPDPLVIDVDGEIADRIPAELLEFDVLEVLRWITPDPNDPTLLVDRTDEQHSTLHVRTFGEAHSFIDASRSSADFFLFLGIPVNGESELEASAVNFAYQIYEDVAYSSNGEHEIEVEQLERLVDDAEADLLAILAGRGFTLVEAASDVDDPSNAVGDE